MDVRRGSSIIPSLRYRGADALMEWWCNAPGFARHAVHADGDSVHHAHRPAPAA